MHLVNSTTDWLKRTAVLVFTLFIYSFSVAQENSPYSRYGIGDLAPNQNVSSRAMGGVVAGYFDKQGINLSNPAALAGIGSTIFDLGGEITRRTLKSNISPDKYTSTNTLISYIQVGFPIATQKMQRKNNFWGVSFGLRPITRINYKVEKNERLSGIDSLNTLYEGNGGLTQANISTALKLKNFSFGISSGYTFANKDYSTKLTFINDTALYYKSNTATQTRFGGVFLTLGAQYDIKMKKGAVLRLGAYANLQQNLKAKRDNINETFAYDGSGGIVTIDTVTFNNNVKGEVTVPASYSAGFTYNSQHWTFGADFDFANWADYRYYGQKDVVKNNWKFRAGAQYYPAKDNTPISKYWSFVKYKAGIYYGPDYIILNKDRPDYGITLGASFPASFQRLRFGELVTFNTAIEIGARGDKNSQSLRENVARFSLGISMNARWFQKPKYD